MKVRNLKVIDMDMNDDEFVDFLVSLPPNADGELTEKMYEVAHREFEKAKAKGPVYDKSFAEFLKRYESGENN